MKKIIIPKEKRKIKLELIDPVGFPKTTYTLPYEVEGEESMIQDRLILTIGKYRYWIKGKGSLLVKIEEKI